ncbi:type II toxin-antitoxin system HigB family toxin [Dyadobacter sp. NIV53]|uniref:type II toxin-antitoxin system HigB family toxin n=1 Tax=Dyadobacter sp. NIV53 TaxID=2861765 RepID=UPI001C86A214|nr:type II toxin-antitoxin system HigB family toxin [Dyadobacter sp. NIV53]
MVIISKRTINQYIELEPRVSDALLNWYRQAKAANWNKFQEVKKTFNSADAVGNNRYVFNIKGNDYRLITIIHFDIRTIYIVFVGTHAEYDKVDASLVKYKN